MTPDGHLRSVSQRRFLWPVERPLRAVCTGGGHPAPAGGCNCGIYGARDLETLRVHGLCLSPDPLVVGEVALWGRVISDERGHRAELAYPERLAVVEETAPGERLAAVTRALAAYGRPVDSIPLSDAVGEVSAAQLAFQLMSLRGGPVPRLRPPSPGPGG